MKVCNKCGVPSDNFSPDLRNKDGLQSICRPCSNSIRAKKYKLNEIYRYKVKQHQRKYNKSALKRALIAVQTLPDSYIIKELRRGSDLSVEDIKRHPELIELKRQVIKNKRLCQKLKTSKI